MNARERHEPYDDSESDRTLAGSYSAEDEELAFQPSGDPDVLLDVPLVKVDEIHLDVENLRARVSLQAEVLDLLRLNVGADVMLGKVELDIKGVEAQALLKVRLDRVAAVIGRVLSTIDRNPQILEHLTAGLGAAAGEIGRGAGRSLDEIGRGAGQALPEIGRGAGRSLDHIGRGAGTAAGELGRGAGRSLDEVGRGAGTAAGELGRGAGRSIDEVGRGAGAATGDVGRGAGAAAREAGGAVEGVRDVAEDAEEVPRRVGGAARDVSGTRAERGAPRGRDRYNEEYRDRPDDQYDDRYEKGGEARPRRPRLKREPERKAEGRPP
jgi:hypothetical protein